MTKEQARDKESSAKRHRTENNGRRSLIAANLRLVSIFGGIVTLARRWVPGKVATKARIPLAAAPVARGAFRGAIFADWVA